MRRSYAQSGMTLFEILVVLATVLILAGALVGVGKHIVQRADIDLTRSAIEVIVTATEQYYADHDEFPFHTDRDLDGDSYTDNNGNGIFDDFLAPYDSSDYDETELKAMLMLLTGSDGQIIPDGAVDDLGIGGASSTGLFFCLNRNSDTRAIIDSLTDSLISNKDIDGNMITFNFTDGSRTIDLPRFVDVWGVSIRYEYLPDTAFPVLTSAGPDKAFGTADDITSK